ncbi:MAG: hypothetical protein R2749_17920 [Acidimicrobiales bacterium]
MAGKAPGRNTVGGAEAPPPAAPAALLADGPGLVIAIEVASGSCWAAPACWSAGPRTTTSCWPSPA